MVNTNLVIVESAAKSKTIAKYLNSSKELKSLGKFVVVASFGHIRDLVKDGSGIDVDNNFATKYVVIPEKFKVVQELKKKAKDATMVYIASDPDREGESIAMHIKEVLGLKKYSRITFTEITQKALEHAVRNPRKIDNDLVDAQETRRVLDRLVGFKLSPLLWRKYTTQNVSTLSAGRVQSAVLHMIINKENEIEKHETTPYWTISGNFDISVGKEKDALVDIKLYKGTTIYKVDEIESIEAFFKGIKNVFTILDVTNKLARQSADMPFITSTLQQEAYSKLGLSLKRSMAVAQELYEGGYITYMRTDSYNMSDDFKVIAQTYIENTYGADFYEGGKNKARAKVVKGAQEAHECIRITDPSLLTIPNPSSSDTQKLYDLVWKRTVAYLIKPCIYDELNIKIVDKSFSSASDSQNPLYFSSTFKKVKFNGWQIVYGVKNDSYDFQDYLMKTKYTVICKELSSKNVWTSPPQR
jgi:DNA topoisomerase I